MKEDRLSRLAALTRGAAVLGVGLGLGAGGGGCTKNGDETQPPTMNAPAPPPVTPADTTAPTATGAAASAAPGAASGATASASAGHDPVRRFPIPNAMPGKMANPDGGEPIDRK